MALRLEAMDYFDISATALDSPEPGYVRFRGTFRQEIPEIFDELRRRFERLEYTPLVRPDESSPNGEQVALIAMPVVFERKQSNWTINLVLFLATIVTTLVAGASLFGEEGQVWELWRYIPYAGSVLLILGAHELGHYFAARYHNAPVTLPYFIPFPSLFGTMGAVIMLREPLKNRRALFDMGAAGPLAGLVFAIPILLIGVFTAEVVALPEGGGYFLEGNSLLYLLVKYIRFGEILPGDGIDMQLNQLAWAGWTGLFVTGLNLLPVGQLDGGHTAYTLFGPQAKKLFWPMLIFLASLALFIPEASLQWGIWIALLFFLGRRHAVPLDDVTTLDPRRRALAIFTLTLFIFVFVPIPIRIVGG
jgi:membrane-associated protease RseP (regulator of RpoE activity)